MSSCIFSFIKVLDKVACSWERLSVMYLVITNPFMMFLHSYKCLAADHSGHALLHVVITVFHPWDAGIVGSDAWIYVHIFSTFSPVKHPRINKDLTLFSRKSTFPVQAGFSQHVIPPVPLIHGLSSVMGLCSIEWMTLLLHSC